MISFPTCNDSVETDLTGAQLLNTPLLNKGTAFSDEERSLFHLHGLLPPHIGSLNDQVERRLKVLRGLGSDFECYTYLRDLQDTTETLFYALLTRNIEAALPLVYTPTVGEGCQRFSEIWRKSRGLFLSYPNKHRIREILADPRYDKVRVIVVSDGERILGLGDQGAGGMGIPIGKLALYTGCGGIHPEETLPVLLDVGTNNEARLQDPIYVGWRHKRIRETEYDAFVEDFVSAVTERWPNVLLQWEDFAGHNAARLLARYRDRLCTFNDDIQGTAAVAAATLMAGVKITRSPLAQQRIALLGAGSAGCGIAALILQAMIEAGADPETARRNLYAVDRFGLLVDGMDGITETQRPFVQPKGAVEGWALETQGEISLHDVVVNAKPTVLIGVSGQAGAFTEPTIRVMAEHVAQPIILPLSNPTSRSEATAEQLIAWTDGRALIGSGSPFAPVPWKGKTHHIAQTNNAYIFPGMGLGILGSGARRVTETMFMAAATALSRQGSINEDGAEGLLPPIHALRSVSVEVAKAVARQAQADGVADACSPQELDRRIQSCVWEPHYSAFRKID